MERQSNPLVTWTHIIYGLHAFSLLTGILGAATVVGAFLTGWPSIIAVILNYVKRSEARGTWLESHFRWQIRTFWFGLLWISLCVLFVIGTLGIGIIIAWIPMIVVGHLVHLSGRARLDGAQRRPGNVCVRKNRFPDQFAKITFVSSTIVFAPRSFDLVHHVGGTAGPIARLSVP